MTASITTRSASRSTALRRTGSIARWVLQVFLAVQFASGGVLKLIGDARMVDLFTDIGVGQWLRYLVGVCEVAAAIGLLVPRLAALAALGLTGLMLGAVATNLLIGANPAMPAAFLLVAGVIVYSRRTQLRRPIAPTR
ncbi:DoxX family protein [Micromonospora costi]|uniref:DoxX family membrane protein n=1 Tax=Micromonospora costi TaxID=1530042 RepID=A0A3B0A6H4_9ACTN|nr:DoxX family protein [Micromonospora costi]RKN55217.1 DoxX family membrane protein [Micromonospora costi]